MKKDALRKALFDLVKDESRYLTLCGQAANFSVKTGLLGNIDWSTGRPTPKILPPRGAALINETIAQLLSDESRRDPWNPSKRKIETYVLFQAKTIARGQAGQWDWKREGLENEAAGKRVEDMLRGDEDAAVTEALIEDWQDAKDRAADGDASQIDPLVLRRADEFFSEAFKKIICGRNDWAPPVRMEMADDEMRRAIDLATEQSLTYRIMLMLAMGFTLAELKEGPTVAESPETLEALCKIFEGHGGLTREDIAATRVTPAWSPYVDAVDKRFRRIVPRDKRDAFEVWVRSLEDRNREHFERTFSS